MTKRRAPVTIDDALYRVLGTLSVEHCASVTGRKPHYLRALADPDKREQLTVLDLVKLDSENIRLGNGAPLFETVGHILKSVQAEIFADQLAIGDIAAELLKEHADAHQALFASVRPGATRVEFERALRELVEAEQISQRAIVVLRAAIDRLSAEPPAPP